MLTFFRRIRKGLLGDGATSKYLLYAIGETALVVIGILIALQIHNWNEWSQDRHKEQEYVARLANELAGEIEYLKNIRSNFATGEERLKRILLIWQKKEPRILDSLQYMEDLLLPMHLSIWYNEPVTWTQLVQTGDLRILKDESLVQEIFQYYSSLKKNAENFIRFPFAKIVESRELWTNAFVDEEPGSYFWVLNGQSIEVPSARVYNNIWDNRREYQKVYTNLSAIYRANYNAMGTMINRGQNLLQNMEEYMTH